MPIHQIFRSHGNVSNFINPFSGEQDLTGVGGAGPYLFYPPRVLTIYEGTIKRNAALAAGNTVRLECYNGTEGDRNQTGLDVNLDAPNNSVRGTINGSWPASTTSATAQGKHIELFTIGTPGAADTNVALLYEDALDAGIGYFGFGDRVQNLLSGIAAATNRFTTFGVSDDTNATESNAQLPWPLAGTFQYIGAVYGVDTGNGNTTLVLRKNGVDTTITFTLAETAGAETLLTNSVLSVVVAAGDLISWRMSRDGGGAGGFNITLVCGFKAS